MKLPTRFRLPAIALLAALVLPFLVSAGKHPGFFTSHPAMLQTTVPYGSVTPIITVGDTLPNGYTFEAIPDGLGAVRRGKGALDVFVAHETSLVPFPYTVNTTTGTATGLSDFNNAQVSRLRLSQKSAGVLQGQIVLDSDQNYQRFCSASIAGAEAGFKHPIFFGNEEATDFVSPPPLQAWPPDPANQRQAGLVVALDTKNNKTYELYGMGRLNHENTIVLPGYDQVVALTGDDTFSAPSAQLYMYLAASPEKFLSDDGELYGFVANDPAINDYGDLTTGMDIGGHFIPVPRDIAVGNQTPLENWSNDNNVFQFIRVEDLAYDKNDPNIVYLADTGEPRAVPNPATGRLMRAPSGTRGAFPNGRIFKLVFNADDPSVVDSFSVLIDADASGYDNPDALHNPDNIDTSANSLMVQEDPGSHNRYNARVWRYDLDTGEFSVVAVVDQSADPAASPGAWESSGILDVSEYFGPGAWLINVQAHTIFVESEVRTVIDTTRTPPVTATLTFKREGGQLMLMVIPGS